MVGWWAAAMRCTIACCAAGPCRLAVTQGGGKVGCACVRACARACVRACVRARTERSKVPCGVIYLADGGEVPVGAAHAARDARDEERRVCALGWCVGMQGVEEERGAYPRGGAHTCAYGAARLGGGYVAADLRAAAPTCT